LKDSRLDRKEVIRILIIVLNFNLQIRNGMSTTQPVPVTGSSAGETRCECGQLIAKMRGEGLELKCKRCKRIIVIPFSSIEGWSAVSS